MVGTCEKNGQIYGVLGILDGKKAWNKEARYTKESMNAKTLKRI